MNNWNPLLTFSLLISFAAAQNVTLQASSATATDLHVATEIGGAASQLPQGSVLTANPSSHMFASVGSLAVADVTWVGPTQVQNGEIEYRYLLRATVDAGPTGAARSADIDQHQILVSLQPAAYRRYRVIAEITGSASAGLTAPRLDVDLFDDGVIDGDPVSGGFDQQIYGTAVSLRVTAAAAAASSTGHVAACLAELRLRVLPVDDVSILQTGVSCPVPVEFRVNEAFAHSGVRLGLPYAQNLHVVVLGLAAQPTLVPTPGSWPCVLMPSQDVIVLGQPGGIDLPIPAAVRPFSFHAQAVALLAFTNNLVFTDSYMVIAN